MSRKLQKLLLQYGKIMIQAIQWHKKMVKWLLLITWKTDHGCNNLLSLEQEVGKQNIISVGFAIGYKKRWDINFQVC